MNDRVDATEKQSGAQWKPRARKPELIKVTGRIFCAADCAISNVGFVITENGVVVVDTTESPKVAQRVFDELRKICQLPVSHIIYTHFHDDHVRGASVFHEPSTKIIAQLRMQESRHVRKNRPLPASATPTFKT
jgi:glyoxylase-like metal-dependent hydrolase (beta-lactamase superfamily II)